MFYQKIIILKFTKQYGKLKRISQKEVLFINQKRKENLIFKINIVALQMPEGLLLYCCTIADIIQEWD